MNKYKEARDKLSNSQRAAMDQEYQSMKNTGKLLFKSKITGLDYSIAENIKKPSGVSGSTASRESAMNSNPKRASAQVAKAFTAPTFTGDLSKPQGAPYPQPTAVSKPDDFGLKMDEFKTQSDNTRVPISAPKKSLQDYIRDSKQPTIQRAEEDRTSMIPKGVASSIIGVAAAQGVAEIVNMHTKNLPGGKELLNQEIDESDLSSPERNLAYRVIEAKVKATGNNSGSIEQDDYGRVVSEADMTELAGAAKGESMIKNGLKSIFKPSLGVGLSLGGFNYKKDPETGKIRITDSYDFINSSNKGKDGKFKEDWVSEKTRNQSEDSKKYFSMHDQFTKYDLDVAAGSKDFTNRNVDVELSPADTTQTWFRKIVSGAKSAPKIPASTKVSGSKK